MSEDKPCLAVIGATGDLGSGLALRWAMAGYPIIIGSRAAERAEAAAAELAGRVAAASVAGLDNAAAAAAGDIVVLTVPFANHAATLETVKPGVQGKIVIDVTVPLMPPKVRTVQLPPAGSAGKTAQAYLGEAVRVVSAFQNVAADHLNEPDHAIDCDVLVAGNDPAARELVVGLAEAAGMRAWQVGRIDNAAVAEALTSALIFINARYKIPGAGIRITGDPGAAEA